MTTRKTFVEILQNGRAAMERVLENLTEARSSFWLAAEESKIEVNQIYLEQIVDIHRTRIDEEKAGSLSLTEARAQGFEVEGK